MKIYKLILNIYKYYSVKITLKWQIFNAFMNLIIIAQIHVQICKIVTFQVEWIMYYEQMYIYIFLEVCMYLITF